VSTTTQKTKRKELTDTIEKERHLARRREQYYRNRERLLKKRREDKLKQKASDVVVKANKNDPRGPAAHASKCRCGKRVYVWVDGVCLECSLLGKPKLS
jgi:hypothetical protein